MSPHTRTRRLPRTLGLLAGPALLVLAPLAATATPTPEPTAEATPAGEVVLEATLDPQNVFAPPGSVVPIDAAVTNTGTAEMTGGSASFDVTGDDVTIAGVEGGDGCEQVTPQRVECRTDAALATGETATATFLVQLPDRMAEVVVGEATLHVVGGNGGEDTVTSVLEVGPPDGYHLRVTAPASAEGAAGATVALLTTVSNDGSVDIDGVSLDVDVPAGATVVGATGLDDCDVVSPRQLRCHTDQTLVAYDGYLEATVQVRFDDDAAAGDLGVATIRGAGDQGDEDTVDTAETALTVTAGAGAETGGYGGTASGGGTEAGTDGGTELPNTGGDELADTGAARLPVLLAGVVLLAAGAVVLLRTRRA
ncbi:hypothetical protein [Jiangella alba]|uniref:Gram-positive cocci surface proteins LPxTG domain-containing protein n=1 Tax=Jiangella alba TaxID=561176 RepID=A0A1H5H127_9ACTN|nr:hypothetical protein [Jiangella alba]SEE21667.1 hypothetical protein SAMN04488561_0722 [Jiangella alba]